MTDKKEETQEKPVANAGSEGGEKPAKVEAKPAAETEKPAKTEKTEKPEAKPAKTEGVEGGEKKRASLKETDDDIPEDAELLELTPNALKKRLARASRKELRERFGTDNTDEIKAKLDKLTKLEAAEEERERAKLSEKERYEKDMASLRKRAETAEGRLAAVLDERIIATEEDRVTRLAKDAGMDPEYIEDQFPKFAKFLNENFSAKELKKLSDREIKKWFVERLKAKPKLALEQAAKDETQEQQTKPKVGFTNGGGGQVPKPVDNANVATEKTFKPGKANSMSRGESRAEMKKLGIQY